MTILFVCLYSYFVGAISFVFKFKYFLLMLLSLEFMMLSVVLLMFYVFISNFYEYYFSLIFISVMVCESSLGLSLLVVMVRCYGGDYFQALSVLW